MSISNIGASFPEMSEEELGEGSLGLRARGGGGRAVDHGQVLVGGSEERGEEEDVLEEEEAPNEDEFKASLLQLLDHDLLACDVQLSLFVAAASSYRQVLFIVLFLLQTLFSNISIRTGSVYS